jgi:gametolysin peptidase M11
VVAAARLLAALVVCALLVSVAPAAARAFTGEQRLLVMRVTWGPEPFADEVVQDVVFSQTAEFMRASSFGKTWILGEQTPWFHALASQPFCDMRAIAEAGRQAAQQAGYDLTRYNRYAFLFPRVDCWWSGLGGGDTIFLNGQLSRKLVAHELGHTYGLGHAKSWDCAGRTCSETEYGDQYDTMGSGQGDFNVFEKTRLGWITSTLTAARDGVYTIDRPDRASALAQAFVVETARTDYWFENRQEQLPFSGDVLPTGVLVRVSGRPDASPVFRPLPEVSLLLPNAAGPGRSALQPGQTFTAAGAFAVTVDTQLDGQAVLGFRWLDRTAPAPPEIVTPPARLARRRTLAVAWREPVETGSGVAAYEVALDGRAAVAVQPSATQSPFATFRMPARGTHRVTVRAVDRAENRGKAAVRRFVVGRTSR